MPKRSALRNSRKKGRRSSRRTSYKKRRYRSIPNSNDDILKRLFANNQLTYEIDEIGVFILELYYSKGRETGDPTARQVVRMLAGKYPDRKMRVSDSSSIKNLGVWPALLNRDIYENFKPGLDVEDLKKEMRESVTEGDLKENEVEKYLANLERGYPIPDEFLNDKNDLKEWFITYKMLFLGITPIRVYNPLIL